MTMADQSVDRGELLALTADIVAAHVGNNAVASADLGGLIEAVFGTQVGLASDEPAGRAELTPAVPIRRSITDDHIVCLEDGKKLIMLKRHLISHHGLTPQAYRAKWGLRHDYPMVARDYALKRQELAKEIGLGRKPQSTAAPDPVATTRTRSKAKAA